MTKNPSTTWYFNDWENDPALKACSLAAQGLWMRLLCIAARSPEHGVVQIGSLDFSLPDGLTQIASAVGRPLEEIAPLIDELLSSGAASQDRKKRLTSRRMVRAAALSSKRSEAGQIGAQVTNGKRTTNGSLPRQTSGNTPGKPPPLHSLPASSSSSHGKTIGDAPSALAPEGARSGSSLTSPEVWRERLTKWLEDGTWSARYGLRPDSSGTNPIIPPDLLQWAKAQKAQARHQPSTGAS